MYPSISMAANISRDTKYATVLHLDGCPHSLEEIKEVYDEAEAAPEAISKALNRKLEAMTKANCKYINEVFDALIAPDENAVQLCHELFGMPDYTEMKKLVEEYYKE